MTKKQKKMLRKILTAAAIFVSACVFHFLLPEFVLKQWISLAIFLAAYLIAGGDVVKKAFHGIRNGQVFDENFLMSIATIGAFLSANTRKALPLCCFTKPASCSSPMLSASPAVPLLR